MSRFRSVLLEIFLIRAIIIIASFKEDGMKRAISAVLLIIMTFSLFACNKAQKPQASTFFAMDTFISVSAYGAKNETIEKLTRLVSDLESKLSRTAEGSDIYRLNSAGTLPVSISTETAELLKLALSYCAESDGVFDITVAPLTDLWDIKSELPHIPATESISTALQFVNYEYLTLVDKKASFLSEGMSCDLGGIAKGYTADKAAELLISEGVSSATLQIGSSVYILGEKPDGTEYKIGIRNPEGDAASYLGTLSLKDKYITSSGDYERYFEIGGERYCHIFDTFTGYPIDNDLRSVTVITDTGTQGDYLSTLLFCLGLENGLKKCSDDGISAIFITKDKQIYTCGEYTKGFELTDGGFTYEK